MNKYHTDEHVKSYYQNTYLSNDKLQALLNNAQLNVKPEQQIKDQTASIKKHPQWIQNKWAIAASIAIILMSAIVYINTGSQHKNMVNRIAQEIALNHNKQLKIDFVAQSIAELRPQMKKLDFIISPLSKPQADNLTVFGARYCSIQGQIAAQIKLKDQRGIIYTLYQTRLTKNLASLPQGVHIVDGVHITQWHNKELLFGLAQTDE